jgi:hypothetical protein
LGVHKGKEAQLTRVGPKGHYVFSLELRKSLHPAPVTRWEDVFSR